MSFGLMRRTVLAAGTAAGLTLASVETASAHAGGGLAGGFMAGFAHPLGGVDHVLAMVAVGLWAAQRGGRAIWAIPVSFVTVMALGGGLGFAGLPLPMAERGIALSVLVVGVMVAASVRLPLTLGVALTGLLALFHGHAHGVELSHADGIASVLAGFVTATIALHASGIALATGLRRGMPLRWSPVVRTLGVSAALVGFGLLSR
jgi:urease accessory protein